MRAISFHSLSSFLFRLRNLGFLCCFFVFFLFRNEVAYTLEHAIKSVHLSLDYELGDEYSSEIEMEKQEIILSDVFIDHLKTYLYVKQTTTKNSIASQGDGLSVYLEVLSPPPRSAA